VGEEERKQISALSRWELVSERRSGALGPQAPRMKPTFFLMWVIHTEYNSLIIVDLAIYLIIDSRYLCTVINVSMGDGMKYRAMIWILIFACAIITPSGEFPLFTRMAAGDEIDYTEVNVTTAKQMVDSNPFLVILDVQSTPDYFAGHLRNALSIPLSELEERMNEMDLDRDILVYAETGYGSAEASTILTDNDFKNIYDMCCGIRGWSDADYPVYKKYPSVQSAVDSVAEGASVFLSSGTYGRDVTINKTISLFGENQTSTIIEGSGTDACINVSSDGTRISSLTVRNGDIGVISFRGSGNEISNCTFSGLKNAISLFSSKTCKLTDNNMNECGLSVKGELLDQWNTHSVDETNLVNGKPLYYAKELSNAEIPYDAGQIFLVNCNNISISNRDLNSSSIGITLAFSSYNNITNNTFYSNGFRGISLYLSHNNRIIDNTFESNMDQGIYLEESSHNTVMHNLIKDNRGYGVSVQGGSRNQIFNNTFIRNNGGMVQAFDSSVNNSWDDGAYGNYWSDYSMKYPGAGNDTRIWDTPYLIDGRAGSLDRYPSVAPTIALSSYPVSDAGPDIIVVQHANVMFDGSHSFDQNSVENFTWSFQYDGKPVVLYGKKPSYIFHLAGTYPVTLKVENGLGLSDEDTIIVTVMDIEPPTADAGEGIIINQFTLVIFEGKNCSDNIAVSNYTWSFNYEMDTVVLHGYTASFRFRAAGKYNVTLKIFDARGNWNTDQILVTVLDIISPVASAGEDQSLPQGSDYVFSGAESYDNNGILNYTWSFHYGGSEILLYGVAPTFVFHHPGVFRVILNVTDTAGHTGTDIMNISVVDMQPPQARAGEDLHVQQHDRVVFNGSGSSDNLGIRNFSWSFVYGGQNITLFGESVSFIFERPGNYTVVLKVKDEQGLQDVDFLYVNVERVDEKSFPYGWTVGVIGLLIFISITMMLLYGNKRRKFTNSTREKADERETDDISSDE